MNIKKYGLLFLIGMQSLSLFCMNLKEDNKILFDKPMVADGKTINEYRKQIFEKLLENGFTETVELFKDMARYWIDDKLLDEKYRPFLHRWHVLEHSILVGGYCLNGAQCPTVDQNKNLCQDLSGVSKYILYVAALFHDIGKAGEPDCEKAAAPSQNDKFKDVFKKDGDNILCISKKDHETIGAKYILHDIDSKNASSYLQYKKIDGGVIDFDKILNEWKLDDNAKKIVAILVGTHKWFDDVYARDLYANPLPDTKITKPEDFIKNIFMLADKIGLEKSHQNKDLIKMACILPLADNFGVFFDPETTIKGMSLDFGYPPARRHFAKEIKTSKGNVPEIEARKAYYEKVLYGDPKITREKKGAIAIIDELMNMIK